MARCAQSASLTPLVAAAETAAGYNKSTQSKHATSDVDVGDAEDHGPTVRQIPANPVNVARPLGERYSQLILVA